MAKLINKKVTVVLPTYNQVDYLKASIESVLRQTYPHFELVIVNDGSTDGTEAFLKKLNHPKIKVIHQQNTQLPGALNTGFQASEGELLTWTSSDNYCAPYFLEAMVLAYHHHPDAGLIHGDFVFMNENEQLLSRVSVPHMSLRSLIIRNEGNAAFLYPREVMNEIGLYDTELLGAEDWDYWIRIAEIRPLVHVPDILYYYRLHGKSMQSTMRPKVDASVTKLFQKTLKRHGDELQLERLYPFLSACEHRDEARFHAAFDFGTRLIKARTRVNGMAEKYLQEALDIQPDFFPAHYHKALAMAYSQNWAGAQELSTRLKVGPQFQPLVKRLAAVCESRSVKDLLAIPLLNVTTDSVALFEKELKERRIFPYSAYSR